MKKVLAFLLVLALALGGLGFAHAAVSDGQDDLVVFPTVQVGDPGVLDGLTATTTIAFNDHLRWNIRYPFGGEAVTEFVYSRESVPQPTDSAPASLNLWLSQGGGTSISGSELTIGSHDYGPMLQAAADATGEGSSVTTPLKMADYIRYYLPDFDLYYQDETRECNQSVTPYNFFEDRQWYEQSGCYRALTETFRFPVQAGHTMYITVDKDDAGSIVGLDLSTESGPTLQLISDATAEGVWFVPIFRDEDGTPLAYESPQGHGIYFIPWMHDESYRWAEGQIEQITLNVEQAELRMPLDENLQIEHMVIDGEAGTAQMLTLEDGVYTLTTCDLETGTIQTRLPLLPQDPTCPETTTYFQREGEYLLLWLQDKLALTDAAGETLLLTAPDTADQTYSIGYFDGGTGDLYFDGETLILTDTNWHRDGIFWTAAWRQDTIVYYGEYDCSIMRGNDYWYDGYVTAEPFSITLNSNTG